MSFKSWWSNLGNTEKIKNDIHLRASNHPFSKISHICNSEEERKKYEEIAFLHAISLILKDKKSVNQIQFEQQLEQLIDAAKAVNNIESMGIGHESAAHKVVYSRYYDDYAKLMTMVFCEVNLTPEAAQIIFDDYVKKAKEGD